MAIKEPRRFVPTDQGHADVFNEPIDTLYENDQELASQIESIKTDPTGNGVASKEALDDHAADTDLHVTAEKQAKWDATEANAKTYTEQYAAPKKHTHTASDLPSATTQSRGITQLTNSLNSTATDQVPTAYALKQVYDLANGRLKLIENFAASNSPLDIYPEGESFFICTSAEGIGTGWCNAAFGDNGTNFCMVITRRSGSWGVQIVQEIYVGTSATATTGARRATRIKRDANSFWQPFIKDFDTLGGTINGAVSIVGNGGNNLDLVGTDHVYIEFYPQGLAAGRKYYIGSPSSGNENLELCTTTQSGQIVFYDNIAGSMTLNDIKTGISQAKQSGVDAKQRIVDAINSKGGSASTSMSWPQLAAAIIALVPRRVDLNHSLTDWSGASWPNGGNIIKDVVTFPAGMGKRIAFLATASARVQGNGANTSTAIHGIVELVDQAGVTVPIVDKTGTNGDASVQKFMLDGMARTIWKDASSETAIPSNFNVDGAITLRLRLYAPAGSGGGYGISIYGAATYL